MAANKPLADNITEQLQDWRGGTDTEASNAVLNLVRRRVVKKPSLDRLHVRDDAAHVGARALKFLRDGFG